MPRAGQLSTSYWSRRELMEIDCIPPAKQMGLNVKISKTNGGNPDLHCRFGRRHRNQASGCSSNKCPKGSRNPALNGGIRFKSWITAGQHNSDPSKQPQSIWKRQRQRLEAGNTLIRTRPARKFLGDPEQLFKAPTATFARRITYAPNLWHGVTMQMFMVSA